MRAGWLRGRRCWWTRCCPESPWLSVPFALRYLFATDPAVMGQVLDIVTRAIASYLIIAAGYHQATAQTGAVAQAMPAALIKTEPAMLRLNSRTGK